MKQVFADGMFSNTDYIRIVDYSRVSKASIRARQQYAKALNRLNEKHNCRPRLTYICGASSFIQAALKLTAVFVKQEFVFVKSVELAFEALNRHERSRKDKQNESVMIFPEDIGNFAALCGELLWDEQSKDVEQVMDFSPEHPLYEAASMVVVVRDDLLQLRQRAQVPKLQQAFAELKSGVEKEYPGIDR